MRGEKGGGDSNPAALFPQTVSTTTSDWQLSGTLLALCAYTKGDIYI